jgi:hypothetical protein
MSTAKGAALGIRLAFGFYGLLFMAIAFIAIATAKPPDRIPFYLIGVPFGLLGSTFRWRAITGWKDESSTKPPSEKPRIYTKHPPDADFPYHS